MIFQKNEIFHLIHNNVILNYHNVKYILHNVILKLLHRSDNMTYKSKRTIISVITGVIILIAYIIYITGNNAPGPDDLRSWAILMLCFIGAGVILAIVMQIIFHIAYSIGITIRENDCDPKDVDRVLSSAMIEDEMDKLITLKSGRVGYILVGLGFAATLVALVLEVSAVTALNIMFISFTIGTIIEGCISAYLYERGI